VPAAYIALILGNIVYGSSYVVGRIVLGHMGPATLSLLRLLIGGMASGSPALIAGTSSEGSSARRRYLRQLGPGASTATNAKP
jgi:hypothetical protein